MAGRNDTTLPVESVTRCVMAQSLASGAWVAGSAAHTDRRSVHGARGHSARTRTSHRRCGPDPGGSDGPVLKDTASRVPASKASASRTVDPRFER